MVVDRLVIGQQMTEEELRAAMDKWNEEQDHASDPLPGSKLPPIKAPEHSHQFCPPTQASMSAEALEKKEEEKED